MAGGFNLTSTEAAIHKIVTDVERSFPFLMQTQHNVSFNVSEIVKGGSLGHGTAVPGHYDIDLVIYSRDIMPGDVHQNGFCEWVARLQQFISGTLRIPSHTPGYRGRSVQFTYRYKDIITLDVDLLVSPFWESPLALYRFLHGITEPNREMFTVCASKWQVQFFKENVDNLAKEYIRRAKSWRNSVWRSSQIGKPSSYLISLLVVEAYERAVKFSFDTSPESVKRQLTSFVVNYQCICVYWEKYYRLSHYYRVPPIPCVIDPANPFNNVWQSGINGDCSSLTRSIKTIDLSRYFV